jgi:hypothetical protein
MTAPPRLGGSSDSPSLDDRASLGALATVEEHP